jgi:hypothetical protein
MLNQAEISEKSKEALIAINSFFELNNEELRNVIIYHKANPVGIKSFAFKHDPQIIPLIIFINERAESVMMLANNGKLWDAEIILRSMLEVLAKLYYIVFADSEQAVGQRLR